MLPSGNYILYIGWLGRLLLIKDRMETIYIIRLPWTPNTLLATTDPTTNDYWARDLINAERDLHGMGPKVYQLFGHHAVSGTDIEGLQRPVFCTDLIEMLFEQPADHFRRIALVSFIEQMFIQTGNFVYAIVVVKFDFFLLTVSFKEKIFFTLFDTLQLGKIDIKLF